MPTYPVYFAMGDDNTYWADVPRERALEWKRAPLGGPPSGPSTIIWMVRPQLEQGIPAGFTDWALHARVAESRSFTPASCEALQVSLDRVPADDYERHPDNHPITRGIVPVRPFDADGWSPWPGFV